MLRRVRELERAVDAVVVGERKRVVAELCGAGGELLRQRRAVEERVRGVCVQLDVRRAATDPPPATTRCRLAPRAGTAVGRSPMPPRAGNASREANVIGSRVPTTSIVSLPASGERFERGERVITIRVDLPGLSALEIEFDEAFDVSPHDARRPRRLVLRARGRGRVHRRRRDGPRRAGHARRRSAGRAPRLPGRRRAARGCSTSTRPTRASTTGSDRSSPQARL